MLREKMKKSFPLFVILVLMTSMLACSIGPNLNFLFPSAETATLPAPTAAPRATLPPPAATLVQPRVTGSAPLVTDPGSLDTTLVSLYERVIPGVVSIEVATEQGGSQGSGFVFDKKGNIVTNFHVVEGATAIEVDFNSGLKVRGELVGKDPDSDLAVINVKAPESDLVPLPLADSDAVKVGQTVVALGNPFGLTGTMTLGIVSAKGRTLDSLRQSSGGGYFSSGDIIQTDAAINPGNSGGPLLNLKGEVIGINRAIRTTGTTTTGQPINSGIGFAIPSNIVKRVVPVLITSGTYDYPYLGLSFRPDLTLDEVEALGLKQQMGAYIVDVTAGGPGDRAGLKAGARTTAIPGLRAGGDLVISVDGRQVKAFNDLIGYILGNKSPGDKVTLIIMRDGQQKEVSLTLGKRP